MLVRMGSAEMMRPTHFVLFGGDEGANGFPEVFEGGVRWRGGLGRRVVCSPIVLEDAGLGYDWFEIPFFDVVRVCSEEACPIDVVNSSRRAEDDDRKGWKLVVVPNPGKHLEAIHSGEFQVQQHEGGEDVLRAVGELSFAGEIGYSFFATADVLDGIGDGSVLKSPLHKEDVVLTVFNDQD
jgi:hypothetical protein